MNKTARVTPFGHTYNELKPGIIYTHHPGKTITESDCNLFCLLTRNAHPLHSDYAYAAKSIYRKPVVPGTLILSLAVGMSVPDISGLATANLGFNHITHHAPVFINDTLYASSRIISKRLSKTHPGQGIVNIETKAHAQSPKAGITIHVLTLERTIMLPLIKEEPCRPEI